jgi:hypothetical protein
MSMSPAPSSNISAPTRVPGGPSPLDAPWERDLLPQGSSMLPSRAAPMPPMHGQSGREPGLPTSAQASPNPNRYSESPLSGAYRPAPTSPSGNTPLHIPPRPTRAGTMPLDGSFPTMASTHSSSQGAQGLPTPPPMSRAGSAFAQTPQVALDEEKDLPAQPLVKGRERSGTHGKSGNTAKKSVFGFMSGK